MRASRFGLVVLALASMAGIGGCEKIKDCAGIGCKGSIAEGSLEITGNSQVDGVLRGVGSISTAVTETKAAIELEVRAMCEELAIADCSGDLGALVAAVNAELSARFAFSASISVVFEPAKCEASVEVAVEATARCDAEFDPGSAELECSGSCTGSCEGSCDATVMCEIEAPTVACAGTCEGTCQLEAAAACEGTCNGTCNGTCSLQNAAGECRGQCDGDCQGSCELSASASCSGTCSGKCTYDPGGAECEGEVKCSGSCSGSCEGGCEGSVTPPSASVDCQAAAKAEASASIVCTPPNISVEFEFDGAAGAEGQAKLTAAVGTIRAHLGGIVAALAKMELLVDATGELTGSLEAGFSVELDAELAICLAEQIPDAIEMLGTAAADASASVDASISVTACAGTQDCG